jgi:hypothetical protein
MDQWQIIVADTGQVPASSGGAVPVLGQPLADRKKINAESTLVTLAVT